MTRTTEIEWTDQVWNPVTGCIRVSAGCDHCYAFALHDRRHLAWKRGTWPAAPAQYHQPFSRVQLMPERLDDPLHRRRPARIFVNSMSDLFHEDVPAGFIARVFCRMGLATQHTFQILTKRPERMARLLSSAEFWLDVAVAMMNSQAVDLAEAHQREGQTRSIQTDRLLPNVWLGVSAEAQPELLVRVGYLLLAPAAVRFVSYEPALGPLDIDQIHEHVSRRHIDWLIAGCESGRFARPAATAWFRQVRDDCARLGIAFFLKQMVIEGRVHHAPLLDGVRHVAYPATTRITPDRAAAEHQEAVR